MLALLLPLLTLLLLPLRHCCFAGADKFAGTVAFTCTSAFSGAAVFVDTFAGTASVLLPTLLALIHSCAALATGTTPQRWQGDLGGVRAGRVVPLAELLCAVLVVMEVVAAVVNSPCPRVMVLAAGVAAWETIGLIIVVVGAVAALRAIVPPVLARATSSPTILQLAILVTAGMVTVEEVTTAPWLMMTAPALGPVPIRLPTMKLGRESVPPNLVQLCVQRTTPLGLTRSTATLTSLT